MAWMIALLVAAPRAADQSRPANPHRDLSLFTHSDNCVACHNNLSAANGEDVSIGAMWRATMMANSSRDPYWQASVRREALEHPSHAAAIQDECASCHMPMPQRIARAAGVTGEVFSHLPIAKDQSDLQRLAGDGVSCTVCHQIAPDTLGTPASFNAQLRDEAGAARWRARDLRAVRRRRRAGGPSCDRSPAFSRRRRRT